MTDNSMQPPFNGPARPLAAALSPPPRGGGPLLSVVVIIAGSLLLGLGAGALWSAVAPRVVYQVFSLKPTPTAYVVNPETNAFIAADGWYCFIALAGGALIGLLGYLLAVRRYGPAPMAAVVIGSTAAAFLAQWVGRELSGAPGFDHVLATSRRNELLHAPIMLGSHGALAFWPLAAAAVAGGLELMSVLRLRRRAAFGGPLPGRDAYGGPSATGQPGPGWPG
jgi:hypothetical protein